MSEAVELEFRGGSRRPAALRLLSDDRLARRAATGDRAAFAVIFERHHQALYRYCRAILRHDEDARDALQNTFTRALQALEGEEREIAVRPWLHRIAHNEAISLARRRRPHRELGEDLGGTAPGADVQAIAGERLRQLVADLDELPERQRGALVLRELNDLGYAEIGAALGTSEHAARQSVYEARVMLAELAEGRELPCDDVRVRISAADGRLLRPRRVRAHLRACEDCRDFRTAIAARRDDLGALAPPLAPAAAAALLNGVLGGGGGGSLGGGLLAALGLGNGAAATIGAKGLAIVAATAAVGGGAVVVQDRVLAQPHPAGPVASPSPGSTSGAASPSGERVAARAPGAPRTAARPVAAPGGSGTGSQPGDRRANRPATGTPPGAEPATGPAGAPRSVAAEPGTGRAGTPSPGTPPAHSNAGGVKNQGSGRTPSAGRPETHPVQPPMRGTGNPSPGTPPASSNAGGNGKGNGNGNADPGAPAGRPPATSQAGGAPQQPAPAASGLDVGPGGPAGGAPGQGAQGKGSPGGPAKGA
jgi:RNA polymerase sigma factor (sigma-70 family)